ncbi:SDR family oxidoreductase [Rhodococcus wratislaviensis]|uniref:SDR family oxidoreductase n=1 Tax=Rhodococcus wratislaviensis TaxID=44752 RepID=UPI0036566D71
MKRSVLITGGTGGLGSVATRKLLDVGWRVVVPWLVEDELSRLDPHPDLHLVQANLANQDALEHVVETAASDAAAPLFGVVNLVGGFTSGTRVHETPLGVLEQQLDLNLRTAYSVTQDALPHLIRGGGGSVVCMSAAATRRPFASAAQYITSKAAITALVEALAVEYSGDRIRVNALLPTVIDTPANRAVMPDADRTSWATPCAIAEVIAFLLSDGSAAVTGGSIPVSHAP